MTVGVVLASIFVAAHLHKEVLSSAAMKAFHGVQTQHAAEKEIDPFAGKRFTFDFRLWANDRIAAYNESLRRQLEPPLAVLRIPKVHLEVPVLSGTDELALNRGVGHIATTARPGQGGNVAIAGHRDGFFRVLKDVGPGDIIEMESIDRVDIYRVHQVVIVQPDDVSVLQPTSVSTLTLVTCYPFYFIGSAPKRYIVQASLVDSGRRPIAKLPQNQARIVPTQHYYKTQIHNRK
jgi:sortase A